MRQPHSSRAVLRSLALATALGAGAVCLAQSATGEEVWVKNAQVQIRDAKSGFAGVVATVKKGEKLTVVAREGQWVKVQAGDKQGYVFENVLSGTKVSGGSSLGDMMAGGDNTSGMSTSAAGKGLDATAEQYAQSKNLDPKVVDEMIARNTAITVAERESFMREGNVGAARK